MKNRVGMLADFQRDTAGTKESGRVLLLLTLGAGHLLSLSWAQMSLVAWGRSVPWVTRGRPGLPPLLSPCSLPSPRKSAVKSG